MTLAILIPENTVSRERSGVVRFISVSDPTLAEEFTITQEPGPVPPEPPKADLLDVVFHADGTAEDVSPLRNEVLSYPGTALTCYYHDVYKRIVTNYTHTPGQNTRKDSYYRVDYYTNETFKNGLDDGHTLEVVFRSNENKGTAEYKPFAAHQAGGTGFLICKEGQGGHPACITFLPNDRYLLENEKFRLYYTAAGDEAHNFIVVVEDNFGNSFELEFELNNRNAEGESQTVMYAANFKPMPR